MLSLRLIGLGFAAVLGLAVGSFYTATASRVLYYFYGPGRKLPHRWREFFTRPSFCMHCEAPVGALYLIPLFGYLFAGGRCRHCREPIGLWTLAGELFPGLLFPLLLWAGYPWMGALATLFLVGHLYISMATDSHLFLLDHENALFLLIWSVAAVLDISGMERSILLQHAGAAIFVLLLFYLLHAAWSGTKMGFGDVLLASILAFYLGPVWSLVLFPTASLLSIFYVYLIRRDRKAPIPYGLFLSLGFFLILPVQALQGILFISLF